MSEREHVYSDEGVSPLGTIKVVSVQDPALDLVAMMGPLMTAYLKTRDPKHLRFKPGREGEATWYTLRPITSQAMSFAEDAGSEQAKYHVALACTLARVDNRVNKETGETITEPWVPENPRDATSTLGCRVVSDADIHKVTAMHDHIEEMGHIAYARGKLSPKERRGCGLPRGSDSRGASRVSDADRAAKAIAPPPPSDP